MYIKFLRIFCYAVPRNQLKCLALMFQAHGREIQHCSDVRYALTDYESVAGLIKYSLCKKQCNGAQSRSEVYVWNKA
jgi:hypothetical protein